MFDATNPKEAAKRAYDVVIVGAGIVGAIMAKELANAGKSVVLIEAGRATSIRPEGYASYVETFYTAQAKVPNAPYPENPNAPAMSVISLRKIQRAADGKSIPSGVGYPVFTGPLPFFSDYVRALGGTTLHFLGTCIRMLPPDFELFSRYERGVDWPIKYTDLMTYYEKAEQEIGVSADPEQQEREWPEPRLANGRRDHTPLFSQGYQFPMQQIPPSYLDLWLEKHLEGMTFPMGAESLAVEVVGTPAGRNGMPNPKYKEPYFPKGIPNKTHMGERCEGNSACVPICPVMAKYNALRSLYSVRGERAGNLTIVTQTVASKVELTEDRKKVTGISCKLYDDESAPTYEHATATFKAREGGAYVIAAHAVETAKLLLASKDEAHPEGAANSSGQVGRNLMDHPYLVTHGLAPAGTRLGVFRGPQITSEIPMRDGEFRAEFAAFRGDIRNGGWDFATGAPYSDVAQLVNKKGLFGTKLREQLESDVQRQISFGFQIEQLPCENNRVEISEEYRDQLGNYRPVISYDIAEYTKRGMRAAKDLTDAVLRRVGGEDLTGKNVSEAEKNGPGYIEIPAAEGQDDPDHVSIAGSGHIMGTHRMGTDTNTSVVDTDQRTHDHHNLYLVGCGNMPTVGTSNPTLTIAAMAFMAVDRVKQDLSST